ncbi:MAG: hypothetical protein ACOYKM_06425 [Caulobacterales bacterium]
MSISRRGAVMGLALAGLGAGASLAWAQRSSDVLSSLPLDGHGWAAAPTARDGVGWEVLGATREATATVNGQLWTVPEFTPRVLALVGQRVRVNGYMLPWDIEVGRQTRFALMAYPTSCPFHLDVGPAFMIDVRSPRGVPMQEDSFVVEGRFEALDRDAEGWFYRLQEATYVRAGA